MLRDSDQTPDPIGDSLKKLQPSEWSSWLLQHHQLVPKTFLPNTPGLAEEHSRANLQSADTKLEIIKPGNSFPNLSTANSINAAAKLRASEFKSHTEFFSYMSNCRKDMEVTLAASERRPVDEEIGLHRESNVSIDTPVFENKGQYKDQYNALLSGLLTLSESKDEKIPGVTIKKEYGTYQTFKWPEQAELSPYYLITIEIQNNGKTLSNITIFQIQNTILPKEYIIYRHTLGKNLKSLSEHECEELFQKIQNWQPDKTPPEKKDEENFYKLLGLYAWYLGQATACVRGSAATYDMMIKSLLLSKGFIPKPYKPGIGWDFRAMSTPTPEVYAKHFYNLFEGTDPFEDRFKVNLGEINKHKAVLNEKWEKERYMDSGVFQNHNIVHNKHQGRFDSIIQNGDLNQAPPSIHRYPGRRSLGFKKGIKTFREDRPTFGDKQLPMLEDKIFDKKKLALLKEKDHYHGVWLKMVQDIVGDSYIRLGGPGVDAIAGWINSKDFEFLKKITDDHDKLEQILCWIEQLPPEDRDLVNERSYSPEHLVAIGLEALQQKLHQSKKELDLPPVELARNLLIKLQYRDPPEEPEKRMREFYPECQEEYQNFLSYSHIVNALEKIKNGKIIEIEDIKHLKMGMELFNSLGKEFKSIISKVMVTKDYKDVSDSTTAEHMTGCVPMSDEDKPDENLSSTHQDPSPKDVSFFEQPSRQDAEPPAVNFHDTSSFFGQPMFKPIEPLTVNFYDTQSFFHRPNKHADENNSSVTHDLKNQSSDESTREPMSDIDEASSSSSLTKSRKRKREDDHSKENNSEELDSEELDSEELDSEELDSEEPNSEEPDSKSQKPKPKRHRIKK